MVARHHGTAPCFQALHCPMRMPHRVGTKKFIRHNAGARLLLFHAGTGARMGPCCRLRDVRRLMPRLMLPAKLCWLRSRDARAQHDERRLQNSRPHKAQSTRAALHSPTLIWRLCTQRASKHAILFFASHTSTMRNTCKNCSQGWQPLVGAFLLNPPTAPGVIPAAKVSSRRKDARKGSVFRWCTCAPQGSGTLGSGVLARHSWEQCASEVPMGLPSPITPPCCWLVQRKHPLHAAARACVWPVAS